MQFKPNHKKNDRLSITTLWFLVILCGLAYADDNNGPIPGIAGDALTAGATAAGFNLVGSRLSALNANVPTAAGYQIDHADDMETVDVAAQRVASQETAANVKVASEYLEPDSASATQAQLIKINQAAEELYAATDDFGNALALAIIDKYKNMTKEEAAAQLVAEGRRYGYISGNPELSENERSNSISLISKAFASTNGDDPCPALAVQSHGHPSEIKGLQNGPTWPAGKLPIKNNMPRCNAWGQGEARYIKGLPGRPSCTDGSASSECNIKIAERAGISSENGERLTKVTKQIAWNATVSPSASADNSDHSSFFISSAYAALPGSSIDLQAPQNKVAQAGQNWCQLANKSNIGVGCCQAGGGRCAANFVKAAMVGAQAASMDFHSTNAASGATPANQITNQILGAAAAAATPWSPE